ncbi:MAG: chemotaxis protein, partial [Burkholderiaceae bacterium]|nr:chemotaxis protein [Burkholderiaceae bacterium]
MKISDWKIGVRLGLGFAVLLAILLTMAAVSINRLGALSDATTLITKDRVPKVLLVNDVLEQVNLIARSSRNAIIMKEKEAVKKEIARIHAARGKATETLQKMEKMMNTPKGQEIFKSLTDKRASYGAATNKLLKALEDGKWDDASVLLLGEVRQTQFAYMDQIEAFEKYVVGLMHEADQDAHDTYAFARILLLAMTAIAFVLGIMVALFATRSITRPLDEAVKVAETVASGDLTARIEVRSKDETGQLMQALKN